VAPPKWKGWPQGKKFALVITHDVETRTGLKRCQALAKIDEDMGFRSSFNFVAEEYPVSGELRNSLCQRGFEVGLHGVTHDGKLYQSRQHFLKNAAKINRYLREWNAVGFRSPSMLHNLEWIHDLDIEYDSSTFDTDPFEPQPDGAGTIFPFIVTDNSGHKSYVELPYTLPQDFSLFKLIGARDIDIWKKKLDWIASNGGMALMITHPDYICFDGRPGLCEYPVSYYKSFLKYIKENYEGQYWHALPKEMAKYWLKE
jgi:hypothetical protein